MNKLMFWAAVVSASAFSAAALATPVRPVPEPGTLGLLAAGVAALVATKLRRK